MRVSQCVVCKSFPCRDIKRDCYIVPGISLPPDLISIALVSEAAPERRADYYYSKGDALFQRTTVAAFNKAGVNVASVKDIVDLGVYLTTAVKCGKTGYGIQAETIRECSLLLEKELALFPRLKAILLMGDVAIRAFNHVALRLEGKRTTPGGSTYRIRTQKYFFRGIRVFPSYLQAGASFFIEKSKQRMIAEDIAAAMSLASAR